MRTTIEIADDLFLRAKALATEEHVSLRSLTEEGLRHVIAKHEHRPQVRIKPVVVDGNGVNPEWQGTSWAQIRDLIYGDRG